MITPFSPFRPSPRGGAPAGVVVPGAPAPIEIPLCWLTQPVALRLEKPYTTAVVSQPGFGTSFATANAQSDFPFDATLESPTPGDAQRLADWVVVYRSLPLMRSPVLVIDLMHRSDSEKVMLLRIERNLRIKITGTPPEYPLGAQHLIVSGITNVVGVFGRKLRFTTRPVIGISPGVSGPWFYPGRSTWGGTDVFLP